nr:AraC family transcriptional regulator [uncultured Dorea sp.]
MAVHLLCDTKLSIEEIALDVGYENQSYFFRQFKKTVWNDTAQIQKSKYKR